MAFGEGKVLREKNKGDLTKKKGRDWEEEKGMVEMCGCLFGFNRLPIQSFNGLISVGNKF